MGIAEALARSLAGATPFTRSLFEQDGWSAARVVSFVNERRGATIATVSAAGQPHAGVIIAAALDDAIYFTVHPASVMARNLAANDRIGVSVTDPRHGVMGQGRAVRVGAALDLPELIAALAATSPTNRFTPEGWDGDIYTVHLARLFAN